MRAKTIVIAAAAFAAGILVGRLVPGEHADSARAPPRGAALHTDPAGAGAAGAEGEQDRGGVAAVRAPAGKQGTGGSDPTHESDAVFEPRDPEEFAWWYAIHRKEWELPELDAEAVRRCGRIVTALGRIPQRDILLTVISAFEEMDRGLAPIREEWTAWAKAHGPAPLGDPTAAAYQQRMADVRQGWADRLHRTLAYSDYYLVLLAAGDDAERRPPPGGPLPGGDPYARPVEDAKSYNRFSTWYHAYRFELGFPERDEEFLESFHQHVIAPLGRLPEPRLMRALQDAYLPLYPSLRDGSDADRTAREFFARLRRILDPLDYERARHSYEWVRETERLDIPGPAER